MKEITRVHIAKQPYDIEVEAKKELEKYMKKLELYAGDEEILADIEIRITELLAEAGVEKGGVITSAEVASVRERLGEPEEFASENQAVVEDEPAQRPAKRLFRDMDGALLGGVLKGVATFFGIDVVWVRLIFIILLFASFGTASLVYILLWIVVPPARTTAEKLQLAGKPVTLAAMREQATNDEVVPSTRAALVFKKFLFIAAEIAAIIVAIGALLATIGVVVGLNMSGEMSVILNGSSEYKWMPWAALGLFVLSGLLLSLLAALAAFALCKRQFTKRMGVGVVVIIIGGIVASGGGAAIIVGYSQLATNAAQAAMTTHKVALPELADVRNVVSIAHSASGQEMGDYDQMTIIYIATDGAPRYELQTQFEQRTPSIVVNGDTARISLKAVGRQVYHFGYVQPQLRIYGPALDSVDVQQGDFQYIGPEQQTQDHLTVKGEGANSVTVYGTYNTVEVSGGNSVDVSMSSVHSLTVNLEKHLSQVKAGVVYDLSVTNPEVCSVYLFSDGPQRTVSVRGVSSGQMTYNGIVGPVKQYETPCGAVTIGKENIGEDE